MLKMIMIVMITPGLGKAAPRGRISLVIINYFSVDIQQRIFLVIIKLFLC